MHVSWNGNWGVSVLYMLKCQFSKENDLKRLFVVEGNIVIPNKINPPSHWEGIFENIERASHMLTECFAFSCGYQVYKSVIERGAWTAFCICEKEWFICVVSFISLPILMIVILNTRSKDIPAGHYLLEVFSSQFIFSTVRIEINSKTGQIKATKSIDKSNMGYPLRIEPESVYDYFTVLCHHRIIVLSLTFN